MLVQPKTTLMPAELVAAATERLGLVARPLLLGAAFRCDALFESWRFRAPELPHSHSPDEMDLRLVELNC